jgi:signal transduction histidine kinase
MQTRALARGLCPVELAHTGLAVALMELSSQTELLHGITCQFDAPDQSPPCDHLTATHLYRIAQESITNAVRHGGARTIEISLISDAQQHCLVIKDDGQGFDMNAQKLKRNNGLRLMEYRANMIGGVLSIDSRPGAGTRISCRFETSRMLAPA